jgi:hypothetical protein
MGTPSFQFPNRRLTETGRERRVGVEIEFAGVGLRESAELIHELFGGHLKTRHRFAYRVESTPYGDFEIDSDASFVTKRKWQKYLDLLGVKSPSLGHAIEDIVASVSEDVVPFEIGSPPMPFSALPKIEDLRERLREAGAKGTHAHFFTAFGLQFNPEMPSLSPETLLGYMRAFFLRYDSLIASEDIPLARKVMPFIDPFPEEYIEQVLDPDYRPRLNGFMRDYLEMNPTRNRPLDWLPLFAYIDKDLVFEYPVEKDLIKPRPTLHYRLPSSLIDDPSWSIAGEWNKWVEIENLAEKISAELSRPSVSKTRPEAHP